ncbi:proteinase inhibitor I4 serpin-like protein [Leptotrombidium deliense]|uniref:Proteinase inhibitor I4 serpin-like protein n=1 Tax=Leptotrombidium deliense TaxID=299467 RepID=A0A443S7S4_9ACAR|nr:proteinase inhibitor I4 serpin-like protein [Leptotrombidium deliense]
MFCSITLTLLLQIICVTSKILVRPSSTKFVPPNSTEIKKLSTVSNEFCLDVIKSCLQVKEPNCVFDAFNFMLTVGSFMGDFGPVEKPMFFAAFRYILEFTSLDEVVELFKKNFTKYHSGHTLFAINQKFNLSGPFWKKLKEYKYVWLKLVDMEHEADVEALEMVEDMKNFTQSEDIEKALNNKLNVSKDDKWVVLHASKLEQNFVYPFDERKTANGNFSNFGKENTTVKFMNMKRKLNYTSNENFSAIMLPLENQYEFVIWCPSDGIDYHTFVGNLSHQKVKESLKNMTETVVNVTIPRFKIVSEKTTLTLRSNKDMYQLLTLSKLLNVATPPDLQITSMIMVNQVEVNEKKVKHVSLAAGSGRSVGDVENFVCNRPFLFMVLLDGISMLGGIVETLPSVT